MATVTQKYNALVARQQKAAAEKQVMDLRLLETGTFLGNSLLMGLLSRKFPQLFAFGPSDMLSIEYFGLAGFYFAFFSKDEHYSEVGMGLGLSSLGGLARGWGEKIADAF